MNASALCPLRGALWHLWACADYASGASACCECLRGACQADTGAARGAQVVKATVLTADADARRLRLSLVPGAAAPAGGAGAPAGGDALAGLQPGDVVEGVVRSVTLAQAGAEVCLRHHPTPKPIDAGASDEVGRRSAAARGESDRTGGGSAQCVVTLYTRVRARGAGRVGARARRARR